MCTSCHALALQLPARDCSQPLLMKCKGAQYSMPALLGVKRAYMQYGLAHSLSYDTVTSLDSL